jgi:hypothetical protein
MISFFLSLIIDFIWIIIWPIQALIHWELGDDDKDSN